MLRKAFLITILMVMGFSLFAHENELKGRDIATLGERSEINGTFSWQDEELYLVTDGQRYMIHLGPQWYRDEIEFCPKDRMEGTVRGFIHEQAISPISIRINGKDYWFRDEDKSPAWQGRGEGMSQGSRNTQENFVRNLKRQCLEL